MSTADQIRDLKTDIDPADWFGQEELIDMLQEHGGDPDRMDEDATLMRLAPRLLAVVDAVLDLHRKAPIYTTWPEDCDLPDHADECPDVVEAADGETYCAAHVGGYTCAECAELTVDDMNGELPTYPCGTRLAITTAMEES